MPYFVRIKSRVFGPFDESQLLEMKSKGKITRLSEISENNKHDWQSAEAFTFLFEPAGSAPSDSSAPQPSANEQADWFYSVNGTEGYGPVTATAIEQMLRSGSLSNNSYVWQQGENARLIKNEPRFAAPASTSTSLTSVDNTSTTAYLGGEITGTSEQVDTGQMLRPIAASLGWLMFLKITWLLVGVVIGGLSLLLGGGFWISHAVGKDDASVLLVVLLTLVLEAGLYGLQFKTFLCFWKYHTDLYQTVATGRASDLIQANQSQYLFWKWLGITVIAWLSVLLLFGIVMALIVGLASGGLARFFG